MVIKEDTEILSEKIKYNKMINDKKLLSEEKMKIKEQYKKLKEEREQYKKEKKQRIFDKNNKKDKDAEQIRLDNIDKALEYIDTDEDDESIGRQNILLDATLENLCNKTDSKISINSLQRKVLINTDTNKETVIYDIESSNNPDNVEYIIEQNVVDDDIISTKIIQTSGPEIDLNYHTRNLCSNMALILNKIITNNEIELNDIKLNKILFGLMDLINISSQVDK